MYPYNLFKLSDTHHSSLSKYLNKHVIDTEYSKFLSQPQMQNGFNIYVHKKKDEMSFVNLPNFKGKNFYYVVNPFEHILSNNDKEKNDINTNSKLYFNLDKDSVGITSRAFYKLWEMLLILDPFDKKSVVTAHLAEAPGSFVQATMFFREKFYKEKDIKNDEHYTVSIDEKNVPSFKQEFRKAYNKVKIYDQDGGDLTSVETINGFSNFSKKADFITADGGFDWNDENMQEQESFRLILGEIITALKIQKNGGTFVLKLFELYTDVSIKLLMILTSFYEESYIYKPFTSRPSNSERYIICRNFTGIDENMLQKLISLLVEMNMNHTNGLEISNILTGIEIPLQFKSIINMSSIKLSNIQFEYINKMLTFVGSGNYYGDQFHKYLSEQQKANEYWIKTFLPIDNHDYNNVRKIINAEIINNLKMIDEELKDYISQMI